MCKYKAKKLLLVLLFSFSIGVSAETNFLGMLLAAENGDSTARVIVAYAYYFGEYRDGTQVEKDINKAYAWASLANYQGNSEAKKLVNGLIPKLPNREEADSLVGELFNLYGAKRSSDN